MWSAASLRATVRDVFEREGVASAVLNFSFRAHFSDFLIGHSMHDLHLEGRQLTYRTPEEYMSLPPAEKKRTYQLVGNSCATCDYKAFYTTPHPLHVNDIVTISG